MSKYTQFKITRMVEQRVERDKKGNVSKVYFVPRAKILEPEPRRKEVCHCGRVMWLSMGQIQTCHHGAKDKKGKPKDKNYQKF